MICAKTRYGFAVASGLGIEVLASMLTSSSCDAADNGSLDCLEVLLVALKKFRASRRVHVEETSVREGY